MKCQEGRKTSRDSGIWKTKERVYSRKSPQSTKSHSIDEKTA
jgi:hypothetical protein